jgi:signal transduction histidine kinase
MDSKNFQLLSRQKELAHFTRSDMSENIEIFVVEESHSQAEQLKHILEQHGHTVSVEHNAILALAAIHQHKPQIVISAVNLPDMDGYALCREIKGDENLKDIPVILLTSLSDTKDIIRGLECGADNFVTKPYDEKLMISRIEYIVLNRALRVGAGTQTGLEIIFNGEKYSITPERQQMVDLLISTYEAAVQKNLELMRVQGALNALNEQLKMQVQERTSELADEITERKVAERALFDSEERLQQSQRMEAIGTLAGGVAHDFNNLLTVILGNTQLVLGTLQPDDPSQLRLVDVEKAANRAAMLTRQLLAFSRRQHLERRALNLNDTIHEIMKLLRRIIGADVEVRVIATPDLSVIFADPGQIEQVIMNLAVNARDAMPHGGKLTIETSNIELDENYQQGYPYIIPGKYVQVSVSDSGSGIDTETQKRIFEPFFTTKEVDKGTGLGLSMVYGIIKQHEGHINVYSEVGQGTTFKIFLPIIESAVEPDELTIRPPLLGGTETILVADDEETLQHLSRNILEGLGYTVLLAKNGEEVLDIYKANCERIDLLLLDVVMPRMGGIEAYKQIGELGTEVPIIFMTGYSFETIQSQFIKQNELKKELTPVVIQKPYTLDGLGRKVREVLDKSKP